ncbi:MAG TPA: autotransporter outer membrane beta-barrel domain-containing protein [Gammaproteobacteria bacterium]|nr:autotransporter outer membrane beta-barrel domain-containing protein [Gammaproteobacteria bacterium]
MKSMPRRSLRLAIIMALGAPLGGIALPAAASGLDDYDPTFDSPIGGRLQGVARTGPQQTMGALIEDVCPAGLSRGRILDTAGGRDLADRCTDMVEAALATGDLDAALNAMQEVAGEEVDAIATSEVDASSGQMDAIGARLQSLRSGGPRVAFALPGFEDALAARGGAGLLSGGGASADGAQRLGVFVNGSYDYTDRDPSFNEAGFEADGYGVTAGLDYQLSDALLLGAAFSYKNTDADIAQRGGTLDTDSVGGYGYATYTIGGGWYLDAMGGYTQNDHEQVRTLAYAVRGATRGNVDTQQTALSELDSDEIAGSVKLGFDAVHGAWTVSPYVRAEIAKVEIDGYTERMSRPSALGNGLALQIDDQSFTSVMSAVGAQFGWLSTQTWGTWYPQVMAEYVHEFDNDGDPITGRFVNAPGVSFRMGIDDPDRNFANIGVASSFVLNSGTAAFVSFQTLLGYHDLTAHAVELGLRVPF